MQCLDACVGLGRDDPDWQGKGSERAGSTGQRRGSQGDKESTADKDGSKQRQLNFWSSEEKQSFISTYKVPSSSLQAS